MAIDKEKIVGFVDLDENYVDRLYVAKDYQRQKIATRLMDKIENHAKKQGQISLYSHVSITAKKFFLDRGYIVNKEQYVEKQNILFKNYVMEKFYKNKTLILLIICSNISVFLTFKEMKDKPSYDSNAK